ncbi:hypothetical protein DCC85_17860 [Paenibacillus sp. CAA11]|uniref:YolD-like family protein n=1 Tax=Paenibacillus sp. CAA11 TaxID=1532905 RepID=UPI000D3952AF|nr:YolD-like family protein [Paenibacillus sp. CAA11]AWB45869.1 hypothetical protein DCC85_17860 [Paenibacillus sp. CAA11]
MLDHSAAISESYTDGVSVTFRLYDPYEDREITGVMTAVDIGLKTIKVRESDEEPMWIPFPRHNSR